MRRVKRILAAAVVSALMLTLMAAPAFGHQLGPCGDAGESGNSDFAQHHIVPHAKAGTLGADPSGQHVPGEHQGFSECNPSGKQ